MSNTPPVWMEARCASVATNQGPNWVLPEACHQTALEGGFFNSITTARKHFQSHGWRVIEADWWCPVCAKIRSGQIAASVVYPNIQI